MQRRSLELHCHNWSTHYTVDQTLPSSILSYHVYILCSLSTNVLLLRKPPLTLHMMLPSVVLPPYSFTLFISLLCPAVLCPPYTGNLTANVLVSVVSGSGYGVGTVLAFSCYGNNHIVGDRAISCLTTGVWNGTVPLCTCCRNLGQHLLSSQIKHYLF